MSIIISGNDDYSIMDVYLTKDEDCTMDSWEEKIGNGSSSPAWRRRPTSHTPQAAAGPRPGMKDGLLRPLKGPR
jgi:hypothetical protein